ncbi:hypothetical protein D3C78_1088980 [compost metagenome]
MFVHRRGQLQRLAVVFGGEVFLEARMAHQVVHRLADVLRSLQAQQALRGGIPRLQVAVAVEHDDGVAQRGGGLFHAVDHRLQVAAHALVAALQAIDAVEHLAPEPVAVRRLLIRLMGVEPVVEALQLAQGPAEVDGQADRQGPAVVAGDQADQQGAGQHQQQVEQQRSTPILIHDGLRPVPCERSVGLVSPWWRNDSRFRAPSAPGSRRPRRAPCAGGGCARRRYVPRRRRCRPTPGRATGREYRRAPGGS